MPGPLAEAKEKVSCLHWPGALGPERYRENPAAYPELVKAASTWLSQHPREAVEAIRAIRLGKYDAALVQVLAGIGSPLADPCVPELASLLVDMNWPVAVPVRQALFGKFTREAVIEGARELLTLGWYDELNALCWEVFHERPDWFSNLIPLIREALGRPGVGPDALPQAADCLEQATECLERWRSRAEPSAAADGGRDSGS